MMDNEPCAASIPEAVITPQDRVFTAALPHTGEAAHSYSLLVVVRYRASSPSDTQQSQPTSNLCSCSLRKLELPVRWKPPRCGCYLPITPARFVLTWKKLSVLPARRRNKRWMQRGQCGVTLRNRHSACRTSVNIGQRCFSDTSVSKSCEPQKAAKPFPFRQIGNTHSEGASQGSGSDAGRSRSEQRDAHVHTVQSA